MTSLLAKAAGQIRAAQSITIILHQNPDGDAIGSACALVDALPDKNISLICAQETADVFKQVITQPPTRKTLSDKDDCYIILDCSESHRTGLTKQLDKIDRKKIIVIDHHHNRGDLVKHAAVAITDSSYSATAEIIDELLKEMRLAITPNIATALLLGIFTDTGGFKHPNTSEKTLSRAAKLVRYGGKLQKINNAFCQRLTTQQRRLWGNVLSNLEINSWGVAVARATKEKIALADAQPEDIFGLANIIALTTEAKIALVLVEQGDGWRGILRTRHGHIDVGRLAKLLGGRGQKKAAGFTATKGIFSGRIKT